LSDNRRPPRFPRNIPGVAEAASDTGRSSTELLEQSRTLSTDAEDLETRVETLLESVRAM